MPGLRVLAVSGLLLLPGFAGAQEPDEAEENSSFFSKGVDLEIST